MKIENINIYLEYNIIDFVKLKIISWNTILIIT
jgi:hypothetical protein